MASEARWRELGDFLRARRAEVAPEDLGLVVSGQTRRVPGLRREEVARATSISTEYYARLEQGRLPASAPVLNDLARVLRLSPDQRAYLAGLTGKALADTSSRTSGALDAPVQRMLDDLVTTPAFVMGPRTEIIGWNALGAALITDFGSIPEHERYFIRLLFTDPAMRELYADWLGVVDLAIAQLRMDSARDPDDERLNEIVRELLALDPDFHDLWDGHEVAARGSGLKILRHPLVGELALDWGALTDGAGRTMIIWTAERGSLTHDRLVRLAEIVDED